jgi:hypothetical protein
LLPHELLQWHEHLLASPVMQVGIGRASVLTVETSAPVPRPHKLQPPVSFENAANPPTPAATSTATVKAVDISPEPVRVFIRSLLQFTFDAF